MPGLRLRLSRALRLAAACGLLSAGLVFVFAPAGAQTGGSFAQFNSEGWWRKNPFPPNVPSDGLAVTADAGEPSRVTAFSMDVHVGAGEVLSELTLTLKENAAPGANYPAPPPEQASGQVPGQAQVVIVACPIIELYTPEKAGDYNTKAPEADCDAARGDGVRSPDGTWNFDITSLAQLWESNALENKGVLLVERVAPPLSFQVVFQDLSTGTPMLDLATDVEIDTETDTDTETETSEEFVIEESTGGGGDNFFASVAESTTGTSTTPLGIVETPPAAPAAPEPPAEPEPEPVVNRTPTKGTLPPTMLLLPLVVAGLALVSGLVLGPAGDPATARRREGGLSRALAQREATYASE